MDEIRKIDARGRLETFRCKVVDTEQKWHMVTICVAAKGVDGTLLTSFAGTAVNLGIASETNGKRDSIEAVSKLEDYTLKTKDADEKYYDLHLAMPAHTIDANALTHLAGESVDVTLVPSQEELAFGGSPKRQGKARGKSKAGGKKKGAANAELGV